MRRYLFRASLDWPRASLDWPGAALVGTLAAAPLLILLGGCGGALFACENADECVGGGADGMCEPEGWCSFADDACPSGRRYGELAGDGKGGTCVASDPSTTGDAETTAPMPTVTSIDPTSASLEGTATSTTETTSDESSTSEASETTTGESSSSVATTDPVAVCGNGIIEGDEDCEENTPGATACDDLGWVSGSLSCLDCAFDTSDCIGCGPDGCSFDPCMPDDPIGCPAGESCIDLVSGDMCTAACTVDEQCTARFPTVCYIMQQQMGTCLPACEDNPCPDGMTCVPTQPPVCVFF